jgi:hypothetical protein
VKLLEGWSTDRQPAGVAQGMLGHAVPEPGASVSHPVARPQRRASAAAGVSAGRGAAPEHRRRCRRGGKP